MLSALKRLTRSGGGENSGNSGGLQAMPSSLQKKFSKGIQYNMKIILKGDRNSGKSCLFRRLQGLPFLEEYNPTNEIQVANIQWNYKASDDIVKVEIWDVVDKGKRKKQPSQSLKFENSIDTCMADGREEIALDASFLDVYKNTQGVILIFDITKNWTFEYVKREIEVVPIQMPILILGNHRDMGHHRTIIPDTVSYFIESLDRKAGSGEIRFSESSMRNGFGLKFIHKFLNLPFLQLQKETLLKQLETNAHENLLTIQELNLHQESDDANYDLFIDGLTQKRRAVADALSTPTPKISIEEAQALASAKEKENTLAPALLGILQSDNSLVVEKKESLRMVSGHSSSEVNKQTKESLSVNTQGPKPLVGVGHGMNFINSAPTSGGDLVDDFMPDDEPDQIDRSFFSEGPIPGGRVEEIPSRGGLESSDDEGNPLVTSYLEEPMEPQQSLTQSLYFNHSNLSSSDEEKEPMTKQEPKKPVKTFPSMPKEKKRSKTKGKGKERQRQESGTKYHVDLEEFLNGSPEDLQKNTDVQDYEEL